MKRLILPFALLSLLVVTCITWLPKTRGQANCTPMEDRKLSWKPGSIVYVNTAGIPNSGATAGWAQQIQIGTVGDWSQANAQAGVPIEFTTSSAYANNEVRLTFVLGTHAAPDGSHPPAMLENRVFDESGNLIQATVQFNLSVQGPNQQGQMVQMISSLDAVRKATDHETGHTMGLGENVSSSGGSGYMQFGCGGQVALSSTMNGMCGANDWAANMPTGVTGCDIDRVSQLPQYVGYISTPTPTPDQSGCTTTELGSPGDYGCYHCYGGDDEDCDGASDFNDDDCYVSCFTSPVAADLNGDGINLTAPKYSFDMTGGLGKQQLFSAVQGDDAWLVFDRNGDGKITSGKELFGNYTYQYYTEHPNGFNALALFDLKKHGGNGDGKIDRQDAVYSELRFWQDRDSNWISAPDELLPMSAFNNPIFDLKTKEWKKVDAFGNEFKFRAKVDDGKEGTAGKWSYDVFLKGLPIPK